MKEILYNLEKILKEGNFTSVIYLQEGVSRGHIENLLLQNNLDFDFPKELFELYEWHNGQRDIYTNNFIDIFHHQKFYPIEDAIDIYIAQYKYLGNMQFPIFGCVDTLHDVIDLDPASQDYLSIKDYDYEEIGLLKKYSSLKTMLESETECYRKGVYSLKEFNDLYIKDDDTHTIIHKKYGAGCEYWDRVS